ncbi:MAG: hypothetical protein ACEQSB_01245 [Undibacterium sp.]
MAAIHARILVRPADRACMPDGNAARHIVTLRALHSLRRRNRGETRHDAQGRHGAGESRLIQGISNF